MATGVNKVLAIGNLGKDPEVRYMPSGQAMANFTLAVSDSWTDKQGQKQERTEWIRVVVFGKVAELCGEYLAKGRQVYVEGRMQTRQWDDRDGNKRYTTEVVAQTVQFLGGRGEGGGGGQSSGGGQSGGGGGGGQSQRRPSYDQSNQGGGGGSQDAGFDYGPPPSDDDVPF